MVIINYIPILIIMLYTSYLILFKADFNIEMVRSTHINGENIMFNHNIIKQNNRLLNKLHSGQVDLNQYLYEDIQENDKMRSTVMENKYEIFSNSEHIHFAVDSVSDNTFAIEYLEQELNTMKELFQNNKRMFDKLSDDLEKTNSILTNMTNTTECVSNKLESLDKNIGVSNILKVLMGIYLIKT